MIKNTKDGYGIISRLFHWLLALMIMTMIFVGFYMANMESSEKQIEIIGMHKATGLFVLFLVTLRVLWRFANIQPELPKTMSWFLVRIANANISLLYILTLAMPLSGMFASLIGGRDISFYGIFKISAFAENHEVSSVFMGAHIVMAYILSATILLHIAASFYHHFIAKDNILRRMIIGN